MLFRVSRIAALVAGLVVAGAVVGATVFDVTGPRSSASFRELEATGAGPLDGMVFDGGIGPEGKPRDVSDSFVFEDGTFVSRECELRCDYPARPYSAHREDGAWHFVSKTRCPYKDATIVWRGTVRGDRIEGTATWTIHRWYWTLERNFAFEAARGGGPVAQVIDD